MAIDLAERPRMTTPVLSVLTLACLLGTLSATASAGGGPQNVLVLANTLSEDSVRVAEYYVNRRQIPAVNLCRIACPTSLDITYTQYRDQIERPIQDHMAEHDLGRQIDYIVTTQGMPIRVRLESGRVSLHAIMMMMDTPLSGRSQQRLPTMEQRNPYHLSGESFDHSNDYDGRGWHLYLPTGFHSFTADEAIALIDRAIEADETEEPSRNFLFQVQGYPAGGRNNAYEPAAQRLRQMDSEASVLPDGGQHFRDHQNLMGYMSGGSYSHINEEGILTNTFAPGALVDMLESFGAVPNNFTPDGHNQVPVTWFIRHPQGCTGIHGAVAEPYAHTFPSAVLFEIYLNGFNLAETFWMSLPFAYWMNMVIGDPLCQPFAQRPSITVDAESLPEAAVETVTIPFDASGPALRGVEVYVDGVLREALPGSTREVDVDTTGLFNRTHEVRIVGIAADDTAAQGQAIVSLNVANPGLRVMACLPAAGARSVPRQTPLRVSFNRPLTRDDTRAIRAVVEGEGDAVAGEWEWDEETGVGMFRPDGGWAPSTDIAVQVQHDDETLASLSFRTTCARLLLAVANGEGEPQQPFTATAGEAVSFRVAALKEFQGDEIDTQYLADIRVDATDNRAQWEATHTFTAAEEGAWTFAVEWRTAGTHTLTVTDPLGELVASVDVLVRPGPAADFAIDVPASVPLGAPLDIPVTSIDRFGNAVKAGNFDGVATLSQPGLGDSTIRFACTNNSGVATMTDVRFQAAGEASLSRAGAESIAVQVEDRGIPCALVLGPIPEANADTRFETEYISERNPEPEPFLPVPSLGRVWQPMLTPAGGTTMDLTQLFPGRPRNCVAYALVAVEFEDNLNADLWLTTEDAVKVWVNGREQYANAEEQSHADDEDYQGERIPELRFSRGMNTVLLKISQAGGSFGFALRITDEDGRAIPGMRYHLWPEGRQERFSLSGRVHIGSDGMEGYTVECEPVGDGRSHSVRTDARGMYVLDGIEPGLYDLRVEEPGCAPAVRRVMVDVCHRAGLDFAAPDTIFPEASLPEIGDVLADRTVEATVTDNVGVARVQFFVDGDAFGPERTSEPFVCILSPETLRRGRHRLTVQVWDAAGNMAESEAADFEIVSDTSPPRVRMRAPRRFEGTVTVEVSASDRYGVARVQLFLDGRLIAEAEGEELTAEVVCIGMTEGRHELTARAVDRAGNVGEEVTRFTIRR